MKNLSETIKNLSSGHAGELQKILKIKAPPGNTRRIYDELLSYSGLALIISSLNSEEREILNAACREKTGITFAELEKQVKLNTETIEKYTDNLARRMLVYVLKNRQKLSNKLDKVFVIPEIRNILNPIENSYFSDYFIDINNIIESGNGSKCRTVMQSVKEPVLGVIRHIFDNGGVITLDDFNTNLQLKSPQKALHDLAAQKYITIMHDLVQTGKTLIVLNKKIFIGLSSLSEKHSNPINVRNRYNLLLNLLKTYDIVSTYGFFLTKQKEFRKIDWKHLSDAMIKLTDHDGIGLQPGIMSQLALYLLSIQNITLVKDDSLILSLKKIAHLLDDPSGWLYSIIKLLNDYQKNDLIFTTPFEIPLSRYLIETLDLIYDNPSSTYKCIEFLFFIKTLTRSKINQYVNINQIKQNVNSVFKNCMRLLCISGITDIENSLIRLSDIGIDIAEKLKIIDPQEISEKEIHKTTKDNKKIYLNSDFMLMIPKEIPSEALYHLSTHTETVIDDVILQTRITRESILTSLKRGMSNDKFFSTLNKYLKTEIPGNLNFLISEWSGQTIRLTINNATILHTNQPSFIDKIAHSKIKSGILKRISENYALIDKRYLDKIIKIGKENDAVVNLFDESGEQD